MVWIALIAFRVYQLELVKLERFHNSRALSSIVRGGIFLRKMPLDGSGFRVQQLWNRFRQNGRWAQKQSRMQWLRRPQAGLKGSDTGLFRACPFHAMSRSRKQFFPFGIIASGIGSRLGLTWKFFDSSHAPSRGSRISGWARGWSQRISM